MLRVSRRIGLASRSVLGATVLAVAIFACNADILVGSALVSDASLSADASGTHDASPSADALAQSDTSTETDAGCGAVFSQEGAFVTIRTVDDVLPSPTGGTLIPGTYVLTDESVYLGGRRGTAEARETLVVRGSDVAGTMTRLEERRNAGGNFTNLLPTGSRFDYETAATNILWQDAICPEKQARRGSFYSVAPNTLKIHDSSEQLLREYHRIY